MVQQEHYRETATPQLQARSYITRAASNLTAGEINPTKSGTRGGSAEQVERSWTRFQSRMDTKGEYSKNSSPILKRHHERMQGKGAVPLTISC